MVQLRGFMPTWVSKAMGHALVDQGGKICTIGPGGGEIVYKHDGTDKDIDKLLLHRSIEGSGPRLSRGIPKRLRDLMYEGLISEKVEWLGTDMIAWIESKLGSKKGDSFGEMKLMERKLAEILQAGEIPRMLVGPRPVVRRARIV
ncbi:hypothetical protein LTR84_009556 [Exophiala bonariae]|uniref:Uncharacterized protein n=1 Tax=Exophiala bonariae TaxID=1690606 RepID=A0AAV9MY07_9EURO|nr:hypothetical protein LTR84_009556 [Exophiala bonariae]